MNTYFEDVTATSDPGAGCATVASGLSSSTSGASPSKLTDISSISSSNNNTGPPVSTTVIAKNGLNAELKELRSADGRFRFVVEDDGSLVLYMESDAIWAIYAMSAHVARPVDDGAKLVLQSDGNLLVLLETRGCIWSSNTANSGPAPFRLTMQNDGNCALYDGRGTLRWSTRTMGWG